MTFAFHGGVVTLLILLAAARGAVMRQVFRRER